MTKGHKDLYKCKSILYFWKKKETTKAQNTKILKKKKELFYDLLYIV